LGAPAFYKNSPPNIDERLLICYNHSIFITEEVISMGKSHICIGLTAHVGASRREPHLNSFIPGSKTGDFSCPAEVKRFQGLKIPPYIVVLQEQKPQHMVVNFQDSAL